MSAPDPTRNTFDQASANATIRKLATATIVTGLSAVALGAYILRNTPSQAQPQAPPQAQPQATPPPPVSVADSTDSSTCGVLTPTSSSLSVTSYPDTVVADNDNYDDNMFRAGGSAQAFMNRFRPGHHGHDNGPGSGYRSVAYFVDW